MMINNDDPQSPFPPRYAANWQPTYSILQENLIYQVTQTELNQKPVITIRDAATPCGTLSLA